MCYEARESFNDWTGRGYDDSVPVVVTKQPLSGIGPRDPLHVSKLAPNSIHFTRGLVKYVPGKGYFRDVLL